MSRRYVDVGPADREKDWQLCDACDQPINPKWKPKSGLPTPERPVTLADASVMWVHRACPPLPAWVLA